MRARRIRVVVVMMAILVNTGCALHKSSPTEWGFFLRAAPGFSVGNGELTVHPMASYTRLYFDGGRDELFELGGQVRRPSDLLEGVPDLWVGVEAAGSRLRTSFNDDILPASNYNGWSVTGLAGAPIVDSKWGVNVFGGLGISYYGSQGWNARLGLDFQPWFLSQ